MKRAKKQHNIRLKFNVVSYHNKISKWESEGLLKITPTLKLWE